MRREEREVRRGKGEPMMNMHDCGKFGNQLCP